jgi:asparagine synthase (glutamine-hydrolysing)
MSGICGIFNLDGTPVSPDLLHKMAEGAAHRGPDGMHYWISDNIGLAHLALHVTPESVRENQPLLSRDGQLCLTADARLDNRPELIEILTARSHLLEKEPTDADLILTAYQCWGADCPVHLVGDFAFAIWDARQQRLLCVRDARGVKPLHHSRFGQTFCFASEVGQVIEHPGVPRRLDEIAVADILTRNFHDEEWTLFRDVRRLPPAHRLIANTNRIRLERYWDLAPSARIRYRRDEEYVAHFLHLFRRAVEDRLRTRAKVVGIAMSGGLDSCSIAAVAQRMLSGKGGSPRLVAYSFAFDKLKDCDERAYSQRMADELGVEIEYMPAEQFWFLREPVSLWPNLESPCLWFEYVTRRLLGRLRDREGRVLLSGEGGDGLLRGTPLSYGDRFQRGQIGVLREILRYAKDRRRPCHRFLYRCLARPLIPDIVVDSVRRLTGRTRQPDIPEWISLAFAERIGLVQRLIARPQRVSRTPGRQRLYERTAVLTGEGRAVSWHDHVAGRHGVEARHPFLDRRLLEFVWSIPQEQLFRAGQNRVLHRRAMAGILPETIRAREDKTIFDSFVAFSLRDKEAAKVRNLLEAPLLGKIGAVIPEKLRLVLEEYLAGKGAIPVGIIFPTIVLELWLRKGYIIRDGGLPGSCLHSPE